MFHQGRLIVPCLPQFGWLLSHSLLLSTIPPYKTLHAVSAELLLKIKLNTIKQIQDRELNAYVGPFENGFFKINGSS